MAKESIATPELKEPESWTFDCGSLHLEGAIRQALDLRPHEWPSRLLVTPDVALAMWDGGMFPLPAVVIEVMGLPAPTSAILVYPDGGRVYLTNYRDR